MSHDPIKAYPTYLNADRTRALLINAHADGGVFLKLSTIKENGHTQLGSILLDHGSIAHVLFEIAGGNATDQDLEDGKALAMELELGHQTRDNLATLVRRALLALHFHQHGAPGEPVEAPANSTPNPSPETLQDPDYDPTAEAIVDGDTIHPEEPNIVAALARENAELRQKLAAIQSLTTPAED
ncbi:hypothetical protein HYQ19_gp089 [Arthrobacter phage DrYang]|uniref:Uncharacterized protein n=1 Tax=Arthrobacter phage DrYang TaxID=2686080 RepID=A0A6B9J8I6_9CAUD|nr:hypothetical protein HYQ19_gp089 [Arthrobacter phage DrYang]QGZ17188.1 hypothetical protein SEA_DRYANG_89 [Arthrobacter phage DrYang]